MSLMGSQPTNSFMNEQPTSDSAPKEGEIYRREGTLWCVFGGEEMALSECARRAGLPYQLVYQRLFRSKRNDGTSMSLAQALARPSRQPRAFSASDYPVHRKSCRCSRCEAVLKAQNNPKVKDLGLIAILAPDPADDGRWFRRGKQLYIEHDGEISSMSELAARLGLSGTLLRGRLCVLRWPIKKAAKQPRNVKNPVLKHGTKYCYDRYKCRCELCRAVNASYSRKYYIPKPNSNSKP